jgi:outer membrane protein assembly factor BamA
MFPGAIEPEWLDRGRLEKDGRSIESWMAELGYFDAKFVRWEVTRHRSERRKMHPVSIKGYIFEGEPSRIRKVDVVGLDGLGPSLRRKLLAANTLARGRIFRNADYTRSLSALRSLLLDNGFAYAKVSGVADAYPAERAVDLVIQVDTGPRCTFGPISIAGVAGVPERVVADTVVFKEGDLFRQRNLTETRSALFGLRVFSLVNVLPGSQAPSSAFKEGDASPADAGSAVVPVGIVLRKSKWRRIKVGPGFEVESGKGTLYGALEWEHANLFERLWRFKQTARAGAAGVVAQDVSSNSFSFSQLTMAPVADLESALSVPAPLK